jgi:hypothetical protein
VLGGVDGSKQLPLLSMNMLNLTEPATFSNLLFWGFRYFFPNLVQAGGYSFQQFKSIFLLK